MNVKSKLVVSRKSDKLKIAIQGQSDKVLLDSYRACSDCVSSLVGVLRERMEEFIKRYYTCVGCTRGWWSEPLK